MKRFASLLLCLLLVLSLSVTAFADDHPPLLVDADGLLYYSEAVELNDLLEEISARQGVDIVILTVPTLDGINPMVYADDFFDYNGYGQGEDYDGILLLLCLESRDWYVSTRGYGITAITDAGLEYMSSLFVPYFSNGDYAGGFTYFANLCDAFITRAKSGDPYDYYNLPQPAKEPFNTANALAISLIIGLVVALLSTSSMKRKLKSVRPKGSAADYVRSDSMNLTEQRDQFLYVRVSKVAKESSSSRSGGSSTHTSSSGASHGGGGGKF